MHVNPICFEEEALTGSKIYFVGSCNAHPVKHRAVYIILINSSEVNGRVGFLKFRILLSIGVFKRNTLIIGIFRNVSTLAIEAKKSFICCLGDGIIFSASPLTVFRSHKSIYAMLRLLLYAYQLKFTIIGDPNR